MFRNRLIYSLLLILLIFALISILPIVFTVQKEIAALVEGSNPRGVQERIVSDFISISFYVFILAFILSLFLSRKLLLPLNELHRGAMSVRDGNFNTILSAPSKDELGEVVGVFNEMTASLKTKTEELEAKSMEIKEARDFLEIIMNSIEDKIIIIDKDLRVVKANNAVYEKTTAENRPWIIGEFCHIVSHGMSNPCFLNGVDCPVKEVFNTGKTYRTVHGHKGIDGNAAEYEILACPIRDKNGDVIYVIEVLRDVTEMKRLYDRINALYEYHRNRRKREHDSLLSLSSRLTSAIGIKEAIDATLNLIVDSFNAELILLFALNGDNDLVLKSVLSEYEDSPVLSDHRFDADSIEWHAVQKKEPVVVPAFSSHYYVACPLSACESAVAVPISTGGKTLGVFSLYFKNPQEFKEEDIHFLEIISSILAVATERSEFYERMLAERGLAEIVFESISDGLYTVDTDCVITSVNRAAERILGIPAENLIGRRCMDVIVHKDAGSDKILCGAECPLSHAIRGMAMSREMDHINPAGRRISVSVSCAPLVDGDGVLIGAVEVFRDITREKEISRIKTEFVTTVSHEFRTPLSAIVGMAEMLMEKEVEGERAKEYIDTILNEGRRLSSMVSDLLDISRIESGEEIFNEGDVDFNLLLHDIKKTFSDIIKIKDIRIETHVTEDVRGFRGDSEKLRQLLLNLVGNSITYSDNNCEIDVNIRTERETLKVDVSDTGWGIPDEDLSFLTRKFFRGRHSIKTKGTGLGLSLCRDIAEIHGGTLAIRSGLGEGTIVTVTLPLDRGKNPQGIRWQK